MTGSEASLPDTDNVTGQDGRQFIGAQFLLLTIDHADQDDVILKGAVVIAPGAGDGAQHGQPDRIRELSWLTDLAQHIEGPEGLHLDRYAGGLQKILFDQALLDPLRQFIGRQARRADIADQGQGQVARRIDGDVTGKVLLAEDLDTDGIPRLHPIALGRIDDGLRSEFRRGGPVGATATGGHGQAQSQCRDEFQEYLRLAIPEHPYFLPTAIPR